MTRRQQPLPSFESPCQTQSAILVLSKRTLWRLVPKALLQVLFRALRKSYPASKNSRHRPQAVSLLSEPKRGQGGLVPVLAGSPWKHYENRHRLKFGHSFAVVTSTITRRPRMIRSITGPSSDEQIHRLRHLFHPNIVESLKLYTCPQEGYFLVSEFLPTTLEHLYQAPIYPTEPELGSILHQVRTPPAIFSKVSLYSQYLRSLPVSTFCLLAV